LLLTGKSVLRYCFDMARKIRQLIADLQTAGFQLVPGGKGSPRKFRHPTIPGSVILSGKDGDDALPYQEKQVRNAIRDVTK
jgi:predicted RNA binding protein YcfA (HicA-like mRNA interferase family)